MRHRRSIAGDLEMRVPKKKRVEVITMREEKVIFKSNS